MKVEIPKPDAPRWLGVGVVGVLAFALGIGVAAWGTDEEERVMSEAEALPESESESDAESESESESDAESESESESADADADADAVADAPADAVADAPADAVADAPADAVADADADADAVADADADAVAPAPEAAEPESVPPPEHRSDTQTEPPAPAGSLRVGRGRVAYLRCDRASGHNCARDEVLEQAVWAALEGLLQCSNPPRRAGQADIRLDYRAGAGPVIEWRDTFGDDVVRLDRDRVLACLRGPLGLTRASNEADRLLLSFRFRIR